VEAMNNRSQCVFQQRHNNKKSISFINIWCSSYTFRPTLAISREVVNKGNSSS
jgi:hypothetical protein